MNTVRMESSGLDTHEVDETRREAAPEVTLTNVEEAIAQVGARYVTDLRDLAEWFGRYYSEQLVAKDEKIAGLAQRLELVEREGEELQAEIQRLKQTKAQYVNELRSITQGLNERLAEIENDSEA
jgi:hypothetical protein